MKWLIIGVGYLVLIAAVGCMLYGLVQLDQRKVTQGVAASPTENSARTMRKRSFSPSLEQRQAVAEGFCAAHAADCSSDPNTPARSPPNTKTQVADPTSTGALRDSRVATSTRIHKVARPARERPRRMVHHRAVAHHQTRKIRSAARSRPYLVYNERYRPRTAYAPWWPPRQSWGPY
jgi:hypothetical protein